MTQRLEAPRPSGAAAAGLVGKSVLEPGTSGGALAARLLSARCPQQRQSFLE